MQLSKDGYFLKPEGRAVEFASSAEAESFKQWLDGGSETGSTDIFYNPDSNVWVVTQYIRLITSITGNQEAFRHYSKSISAISEANRKTA